MECKYSPRRSDITVAYKCHSKDVITKLIGHIRARTNSKTGVLDAPANYYTLQKCTKPLLMVNNLYEMYVTQCKKRSSGRRQK